MSSLDPGRPDRGVDASIADELIGLDLDDPETRAFAEHLGRMRSSRPSFTVEGYLHGVSEFADSANRAQGGRRLSAVALVVLLLLVTIYVIADVLGFVLSSWFGAAAPAQRPETSSSASAGASQRAGISVGT